MARATEVLRPRLVLIENVPSVTLDVGKVVDATAQALQSAGYVVADDVIDLSILGAPQRRRRHIVLASRDAVVPVADIVSGLEPRCPDHPIRTVRWAIGDLRGMRSHRSFDSASTPSDENARRIAWLFQQREYDLPNSERPGCHQSDHSYYSMYGRLRWDQPAQTVTTGFGSMGQGRYVHPSRRRTITPHEAARLQMLPDFWEFDGIETRGSLARLIGNAVPPLLATALIEPALRALGFGSAESRPEIPKTTITTKRRLRVDGQQPRRAGVPPASSPEALSRMQATRRRDTAAEMALRSALHRLGLRFVVDRSVDGTRQRADVVLRGARVVLYVDGCYWHSCPRHATVPKKNRRWWVTKLAANRRRDAEANERLRELGWTVLRFWEHEDPSGAAAQVRVLVDLEQQSGGSPASRR